MNFLAMVWSANKSYPDFSTCHGVADPYTSPNCLGVAEVGVAQINRRYECQSC